MKKLLLLPLLFIILACSINEELKEIEDLQNQIELLLSSLQNNDIDLDKDAVIATLEELQTRLENLQESIEDDSSDEQSGIYDISNANSFWDNFHSSTFTIFSDEERYLKFSFNHYSDKVLLRYGQHFAMFIGEYQERFWNSVQILDLEEGNEVILNEQHPQDFSEDAGIEIYKGDNDEYFQDWTFENFSTSRNYRTQTSVDDFSADTLILTTFTVEECLFGAQNICPEYNYFARQFEFKFDRIDESSDEENTGIGTISLKQFQHSSNSELNYTLSEVEALFENDRFLDTPNNGNPFNQKLGYVAAPKRVFEDVKISQEFFENNVRYYNDISISYPVDVIVADLITMSYPLWWTIEFITELIE